MSKYVAEPFKIKMVEPIRMTTPEERKTLIKEANYNLFSLKSKDVYIDLQTDSGTGAMSDEQWSRILKADESYSGSESYFNVINTASELFGYKYIQPVHQGRAAEKVLFPVLIKKGQKVISNMHFDTTKAHVELAGGRAVDCVCPEAYDVSGYSPFKGNMDNKKLEKLINEFGKENVAAIIITVTNNSAGGQPVSMENIKETAAIAKKYGLKVIIDAARYAENSFFIKTREKGYENKTIKEIVREMFGHADAFTMSAKKDAIVNMGGIVGVKNDDALVEAVKANVIPNEGFLTYGGMSGRDLEAMAVGLREGSDIDFLRYRIGQVEYLGERLREYGVPFQYPAGGHALFVDAKAMLPHLPYYEFPAHALAVELYLEAGIRGCDIGSLLIGNDPDTGKQLESEFEFTRLAIPRRVYTMSHLDVVANALAAIKARASSVNGYKILWEPKILRHFTCRLEPVGK